ncbi:rab3 GTPase-activating protein non-catalytic subunit [Abrus precatorius]|uniref:Rab3 GTPase-activating protein non-catalytic subunit n=1 Tax=Abrus precatorius TaxID=3816 RepID=A0A8B8LI21_ABRPR|nr:rab3 GTPase-activating protein non-catalytic subunit [Abrus precatorius]
MLGKEKSRIAVAMARRSYKTGLGCVACEELSELGAGKPGWLVDNSNLLCAIDTHSLLIANRSAILLLSWSESNGSPLKIQPELSPIDSESISAIEFLVFDDVRVIVAGTSSGYLLLYSLRGELIHRQIIYPGRVLKLRVRGTKKDLIQDSSPEEFCVVMPGVIARFDGSDIQNMLQKWFEEEHSRFWDKKPKSQDSEDFRNSDVKLPCQLWNIGKYGTCADAAITGIMPPPLMEQQSSQRYYCAVAIGEDAVISAYRLSEDKGRSLVGAILSKVVPATFSTIASFSKLIWRSEQTSPKKSPNKSDQKPQPFARAAPLTCLKDHPRKGEKLTLSPSGTLAAITDSLGRILLLDTQALVVVRLWKGYRNASCLFIEMLVKKDIASSSSTYADPVKSDYCLCLAIHAPRKGIIEIWQMRTGPRLRTISCAKGSKMLQPTYRFGASMSSPYVPLEVFLLNGDSGQVSILNRALDS